MFFCLCGVCSPVSLKPRGCSASACWRSIKAARVNKRNKQHEPGITAEFGTYVVCEIRPRLVPPELSETWQMRCVCVRVCISLVSAVPPLYLQRHVQSPCRSSSAQEVQSYTRAVCGAESTCLCVSWFLFLQISCLLSSGLTSLITSQNLFERQSSIPDSSN